MTHTVLRAGNVPRPSRAIPFAAALVALAVPAGFAHAQTTNTESAPGVGTSGGTSNGGGETRLPTFTPTSQASSNSARAVMRNPASDANLLYFAAQGDVPRFQKFLQRGGSVTEARRKDGKNVLMLAAMKGNLPIVEIALKEGADINEEDAIGMNALMLASRAGHVDVVRRLLESGAPLENRNVNGMTALMLAVQAQKPEVVDALLASSALTNTRDNWGNTALILAAGGQPGIVQSLMKAGADVNARNSIGKTALGVAAAKENEAVAAQLRTAGGFE